MIPPSGAREDSGDGLTGEATGTEQPPSPASTSSLESKGSKEGQIMMKLSVADPRTVTHTAFTARLKSTGGFYV
ncbi:hypothetical protein STEG23_027933, partial [Scotinomys teguina]